VPASDAAVAVEIPGPVEERAWGTRLLTRLMGGAGA
jgi:hypothetical protein